MCYLAGFPFAVWALLLMLGFDADTTRVPFLFVESVAVVISIHAIRAKHRKSR